MILLQKRNSSNDILSQPVAFINKDVDLSAKPDSSVVSSVHGMLHQILIILSQILLKCNGLIHWETASAVGRMPVH